MRRRGVEGKRSAWDGDGDRMGWRKGYGKGEDIHGRTEWTSLKSIGWVSEWD